MTSAIMLAIFNGLFMAVTLWWGAKFSLDRKDSKDRLGLMMPMILMLPRFILAMASTTIGVMVLNWGAAEGFWFVGILMGMWVLIMTGEVMYVQYRLSVRREESEIERLRRRVRDLEDEEEEMGQNQGEPVFISVHERCHNALVSFEARKTLRF